MTVAACNWAIGLLVLALVGAVALNWDIIWPEEGDEGNTPKHHE